MENTKLLNALESKFKLYELNKGDVLLALNALGNTLDFYNNEDKQEEEEDKIEFIEERLFIHLDKESAIDWLYCDEDERDVIRLLFNIKIEDDMVGKEIRDILLESNENYLKVRKDLHLTWYPLI